PRLPRRPTPHPAAPQPLRLRLPGRPAAARADGAGERDPAAHARRHLPPRRDRRGTGVARPARARRHARPPPRPALRRPGPARRDRSRARWPPQRGLRRRAHRRPGPGDRPLRAGNPRGLLPRDRREPRHGHARRRCRRRLPPHRRDARRPDRPRVRAPRRAGRCAPGRRAPGRDAGERGRPMNALLASAPLLLRRRGALADVLPVIAFAAATAITGTVLGGAAAFVGRLPSDGEVAFEGEASLIPFLVSCAMVASVLLIPSAVGLGGSAARLSLARREQDLASIRLVGGTAGQVGAVAVLDVAAQALLGGLLGVVLHLVVTPPLTALDFGIAPFTTADLLMPWWAYPLLVIGMVLLAAGSAAVSLTGVVLSPLGVARDSRTVRMSVVRLVIWAVLILGFLVFMQVGGAIFGGVADGMLFFGIMIVFIGAV